MYMFQSKSLATTFSGRSVILENYGVLNKHNDVIFNLAFDFGLQGAFRCIKVIKTEGRKIQDVSADIMAYQDEMLDIVNVLEDYKEWVENGAEGRFIKVVFATKPFMFCGFKNNKVIKLEIYGHGLYDLCIQFEYKDFSNIQYFYNRIDELADEIRHHLHSIDNISIAAICAGVEA